MKHPKKADRIAGVPALLELMQKLLWYNDSYKVFFSKRHTNNPQEFWFFILDIKSGQRKHGRYRGTTDDVIIEFFHSTYKVKHLANMIAYDLFMIQTTNTENELNYHNWIGVPIPLEKGKPYEMKREDQHKSTFI